MTFEAKGCAARHPSRGDNKLDECFDVAGMQVTDERDYADNSSKKARGFKAPGCKRGIIRLSACHLMFGILVLTVNQLVRLAL